MQSDNISARVKGMTSAHFSENNPLVTALPPRLRRRRAPTWLTAHRARVLRARGARGALGRRRPRPRGGGSKVALRPRVVGVTRGPPLFHQTGRAATVTRGRKVLRTGTEH